MENSEDVKASTPSTAATTTTNQKNAPRWLGSKKQKQEKFTARRNQEGKKLLKERILKDIQRDDVDLTANDDFLKTLTHGEEVYRPPLEITVSLEIVPD